MSNLFTVLCDLLRITKTHTTGYHLCSNGQIERMNRTVLQMIRGLHEKTSMTGICIYPILAVRFVRLLIVIQVLLLTN